MNKQDAEKVLFSVTSKPLNNFNTTMVVRIPDKYKSPDEPMFQLACLSFNSKNAQNWPSNQVLKRLLWKHNSSDTVKNSNVTSPQNSDINVKHSDQYRESSSTPKHSNFQMSTSTCDSNNYLDISNNNKLDDLRNYYQEPENSALIASAHPSTEINRSYRHLPHDYHSYSDEIPNKAVNYETYWNNKYSGNYDDFRNSTSLTPVNEAMHNYHSSVNLNYNQGHLSSASGTVSTDKELCRQYDPANINYSAESLNVVYNRLLHNRERLFDRADFNTNYSNQYSAASTSEQPGTSHFRRRPHGPDAANFRRPYAKPLLPYPPEQSFHYGDSSYNSNNNGYYKKQNDSEFPFIKPRGTRRRFRNNNEQYRGRRPTGRKNF